MENFFKDQPDDKMNIKPFNMGEVKETEYYNNATEGELNEIQNNEIKIESLEIKKKKYNDIYLTLKIFKNDLYKEQEEVEVSSVDFFELNQDIDDVNMAINSMENIIGRKQKIIDVTKSKSNYLVKNN
jgi:nitrogen fixation/metabolism regulation signal transduction histidine kinase